MKNVTSRSRRTGRIGPMFDPGGFVREAELTVLNLKPVGRSRGAKAIGGGGGGGGTWEEVSGNKSQTLYMGVTSTTTFYYVKHNKTFYDGKLIYLLLIPHNELFYLGWHLELLVWP